MLTLFGNLQSGNVHKVAMLLSERRLPYLRVDVSQVRGEPRRPEFLALNPMGKIPTVVLDDGDRLSESDAILFWFAHDSPLWPSDARTQTEVLRWMFFEQYSHEPALAVLRYLRRFAQPADVEAARLHDLEVRSRRALAVMEDRLQDADWITTRGVTIADFALYPYTRWAGEVGVDVAAYPAVQRWLARFEAREGFLPLGSDGAERVVAFDDYFGRSTGG